jgi:Cellulase (glycosyl hydrolase family 5)
VSLTFISIGILTFHGKVMDVVFCRKIMCAVRRFSLFYILLFLIVSLSTVLVGCNSDELKDTLDAADGVPRKSIDKGILGMNAFGADSRFGSPSAQFGEVQSVLGINRLRLLFNWNDGVQLTPRGRLSLGFYDQLIQSLPQGSRALIVLADLPSWMGNSANWRNGNPRTTFVEEFVAPIVARYASDSRVEGFQIWNEPNMEANPDNLVLGLVDSPTNYVDLLSQAYRTAKATAPSTVIVNAATTAINQNFPRSLDYNRGVRDGGGSSFTDVWAIHYYGAQYENVTRPRGVASFLGGLGKRIWITESGNQGVSKQLEYGERTWPFLREKIPSIERVYVYQFAEATPSASSYGLRTLDPAAPISDLYVSLRGR